MNTPRRKSWRRRGLAVAALLAVLLTGYALWKYYALTDPERIKLMAQREIQQYFHGEVLVDRAEFSWFDGVVLHGVEVRRVPSSTDSVRPDDWTEQPVISCREIRLTHDPRLLLLGHWRVVNVFAKNPTGFIVRDPAREGTNLTGLFRVPDAEDRSELDIPTIELRDARITVVGREHDRDRVVDHLTMTIRGLPDPQDRSVYNLAWQSTNPKRAAGRASVSLDSGQVRNVSGGLPWMSIEAVMIAVDARFDGAGSWSDLLGLDGTVRVSDYILTDGPDGQRHVTIQLRDAGLSIPLDEREQQMPPWERYLQFDNVDGRISADRDTLRANFAATFHGSECYVSATFSGGLERVRSLDDVDVVAEVAASGLRLPANDEFAPAEQRRFVQRWSGIEKFYQDFAPRGVVDVDLSIIKPAGQDQPAHVQSGMLRLQGASTYCRFFPYQLDDLNGKIEYGENGIFIQNLTAVHEGSEIRIDGWLESFQQNSAGDVYVQATNLVADEKLRFALKPEHQAIWERFAPTGSADVELLLYRGRGSDGKREKWRSWLGVDLIDMSAKYERFPYRVEHLTGSVTFDRRHVEVLDVSATAESGTRWKVSGTLDYDKKKTKSMDLTIQADGLDIDNRLLAALPGPGADSIRRAGLRGRADVTTHLTIDSTEPGLSDHSSVMLYDAALKLADMPVDMTGVSGRLTVEAGRVRVHDLAGRLGDGTVTAHGTILLPSDDEPPAALDEPLVSLALHARGVELDNDLMNALPPSARAAVSDWHIEEPVDFRVRYVQTSRSSQPDVRVALQLAGSSLSHDTLGTLLTDMTGTVNIAGSRITTESLRARFDGADVALQFSLGNSTRADSLRVTARNLTLRDSLRDVLPPEFHGAWDIMAPEGRADVSMTATWPMADAVPSKNDQARRPCLLKFTAELHDATAQSLGTLLSVTGRLRGQGWLVDHTGDVSLTGTLDLERAAIGPRQLNDISAEWAFVRQIDGTGRLQIDPLSARCYEGYVSGTVDLELGGKTPAYEITGLGHGIDLWRLANGDESSGEVLDVDGRLGLQFYLAGDWADRSSRRGGGRLEVTQGRLHRAPVMLAILNLLNLSLTQGSTFDSGVTNLFLTGDEIQLTDLQLRSESVSLVGGGTLSLRPRYLDVHLVSTDSRQVGQIPVLSDIIAGSTRGLMGLHVYGPLGKMTVRAESLPEILAEFKQLFRAEERPRLGAAEERR